MGNSITSWPAPGPTLRANYLPSSPGREPAAPPVLESREKGWPNPTLRGMPPDLHAFRNTTAGSTASPRGRAFALPSSLLRKDQEFPPPRGRREKLGLDPYPSPSRGKTARPQSSVGTPLSEDGCPHPHRSRTKAPTLSRGGSPPPHNIQARRKDRDLLPSYTLPRVGQGAAASSTHLHIHSPHPYWAGRTDVAP